MYRSKLHSKFTIRSIQNFVPVYSDELYLRSRGSALFREILFIEKIASVKMRHGYSQIQWSTEVELFACLVLPMDELLTQNLDSIAKPNLYHLTCDNLER